VTGERVLVVPRARVIPERGWHGLRTDGLDGLLDEIGRSGTFEPRARVEIDPSFKQVIPYLVLRDGGDWFLMRRTDAGADRRLHGRYSIGIGGHVDPGDDGLIGGLRREWDEELVADFVPEFDFVGLLNDDTTDVGSVHLGVVFTADALSRTVAIRETDKLLGAFVAVTEVERVQDRLETWSRMTFLHLRSVSAGARGGRPIIAAPTSTPGGIGGTAGSSVED